jgi:hypothetical protein
MQIRPLSTYSVFGEKNVSLKDGKSIKIFKVPDFDRWVGFSMAREARRTKPEGGTLESELESLEAWCTLSREPGLHPEL